MRCARQLWMRNTGQSSKERTVMLGQCSPLRVKEGLMDLPRLRIAQIAPLWLPMPPPTYGGAELLVHWLTEELVSLGHDVTMFGPADAKTSAHLVRVCETPLQSAMREGAAWQYEPYAVSAMAQALKQAQQFDVIHAHIGPLGLPFSDLSSVPIVHTVHAGLDGRDELWLLEHHPKAVVASISNSQVSTVPEIRRRSIRTIYHGMDVTPYVPKATSDDYVVFLGRMGPQKNPVGAINIARAAGYPIVLIGDPQNGDERKYFVERVVPLVDGIQVRLAGSVSQKTKIELLRGAAALVFPICWDEHFGLVMIEAMACGTPVLAFRRGSVPEVIEDGVTGFIGENEQDLITALGRIRDIDRTVIAACARDRFSVSRMTADYERLYRELVTEGLRVSSP